MVRACCGSWVGLISQSDLGLIDPSTGKTECRLGCVDEELIILMNVCFWVEPRHAPWSRWTPCCHARANASSTKVSPLQRGSSSSSSISGAVFCDIGAYNGAWWRGRWLAKAALELERLDGALTGGICPPLPPLLLRLLCSHYTLLPVALLLGNNRCLK